MKKSIVLIINRDDVLFLEPLNLFLKNNNDHIVHIYYTSFLPPQTNNKNYIIASLQIVNKLYLLKYLVLQLLKNIGSVLPLPKTYKKLYSLTALAKYYNIPCKPISDINSPSFIKELSNHKVEIVLSNTSQLYKKEILAVAKLKFYNFHPSLLPQNKGRFPIFWAILNNNKQGLTCHEIEVKIDNGKIVHQREIPIAKGKNVEQVMDLVLIQLPSFMDESLNIILKGKIKYIKPIAKPFYGPIPNKSDIKRYHSMLNDK